FLPQAAYRFLARCDQQLIPRPGGLGSRIVPDVEAEEVESFGQVNDPGFLRREGETALAQPGRQNLPRDLFGIRTTLAEHDEVICVAHHSTFSGQVPSAITSDAKSCFQAVQCKI